MTDETKKDFNWGETIMEQEAKRAETIAKVREMFPKVKFPTTVLEPIFYGRFEKKPVENRKLVLDRDSGYQFDIVSDDYKLVHHEEVVNMVLEACPPEFGTPEFKIQMLLNGARAMVQASFPEVGKFAVNNSPITPIIRMLNSINRSTHLLYSYGAEELVCTNGLIAYREKERSKARHINASLSKMELESRIKTDLLGFSEQHKIWQEWAKIQLPEPEVVSLIESMPFSEAEQEKILELPLVNHNGDTLRQYIKADKATLWTVNSAATQFARTVKAEHRTIDLEESIGFIIANSNK